jgi:C1A family cysteine protease
MLDRTPPKYTYGWKRPLPGRGALDLLPHVDTDGLTVRSNVDPRSKMPPVFDQGQLGSCTANATAACFQYDAILDGHDPGELSRLWIYYFEKALEHTLGQGDTGAYGHDAFTVAKHGIPDESKWPYDVSKFEEKPPSAEPRAYTLTKPVHAVPQNETAIRQVLSNNQTIAFGFTVYRSFEDESWWPIAKMPVPGKGEEVLGGHEIDIVGYFEAFPDFFIARNSWNLIYGLFGEGADDGQPLHVMAAEQTAKKGGYFLFPKAVLLSSCASDLRTIVRPL